MRISPFKQGMINNQSNTSNAQHINNTQPEYQNKDLHIELKSAANKELGGRNVVKKGSPNPTSNRLAIITEKQDMMTSSEVNNQSQPLIKTQFE